MSVEVEHIEYAHQHVSHQFEDLEQQNESYLVGMWTFLVTEIMFFGALFLALTVYRSIHAEDFNEAHKHLNVLYGGFNTVVLLFEQSLDGTGGAVGDAGKASLTLFFLGLTILGAFIFLGVKTIEYKDKWDHHLIPGASVSITNRWKRRIIPVPKATQRGARLADRANRRRSQAGRKAMARYRGLRQDHHQKRRPE